MEINGVKLTNDELSTMIDTYLASRRYIMWARWDIAKADKSRGEAAAWFMEQLTNLAEFLPERAEELQTIKTAPKEKESYYVPLDRAVTRQFVRTSVAVGD